MKIKLPEDLKALSIDKLRELRGQVAAEAAELAAIETADLTDEQVESLEALAAAAASIDSEVERQEVRAERVAAARGALAPQAEAEEAEEEDEVEEEDEEDEVPDDASELLEKELVTASAAKPTSIAAIAKRTKAPAAPVQRSSLKVIAASGVDDALTGDFNLTALSEAAITRVKNYPRGKGFAPASHRIANIERTPQEFNLRSRREKVPIADGVIDKLKNERRLEGGSLTAAGGWCAPSEILYELCLLETSDGLLDIPRMSVPRGGISFTKGFQFPDFFPNSGFTQTEAEAEAATEKVCVEIECPDFEEERLDAVGLCVSAPLLTRAAYPELVDRYTQGLLIAHEHYISAYEIARLRTILGSAVALTDIWPNATAILSALELVAEGERQRYALNMNETLEVLLPFWVRSAIRADLSQRNGVDLLSVTNEQIDGYFRQRGLRVQWLYNFQALTITEGSPAEQIPATAWPSEVEAIMYPAGTFVGGTLDVIEINTLYDSTKLSTNMYTALFTEEGRLVANTCADGRRLTIPFNVSGLTAGALINQEWGQPGPLVDYTESL